MSREAALARLGVKAESLYAYVSRKQVRAISDPADSRCSLYSRADVDALRARRRRPRGRAAVAAGTIAWGEPILESGISTVRDGELIFGKTRARDLAQIASLEAVAGHHWRTAVPKVGPTTPPPVGETARARAFLFLAQTASIAPPSLGRTHGALCEEAGGLLSDFANAILGERLDGPIHLRVARAWGLSERQGDIVRRALVLVSDHELNASSFAVRVAASTGASLPAAALAGLAALSGPRHGEASEAAADFLRGAVEAPSPETAITETLARGSKLPGLGHPLYPQGDVRAQALLDALQPAGELAAAIAACERVSGQYANVDLAFAALVVAFGLPASAAFSLFAMGRMAGWLAHAIEQVETGALIRPRAVFRERD